MKTHALFNLEGQRALVTGGGRGLGRDLALGLAEAGCQVIVASRKLEACEAVVAEISELGGESLAMAVDIGNSKSVNALVAELDERRITPDILVNNAGATWGAPLFEYPLEGWDRVFQVNVRGAWQLSQAVAERMKERGRGSIINMSSFYGFRGASEAEQPAVAYNASKGAINALTRDLAVKLAPFGIRVNAIAPGPFVTDMLRHLRDDPEALRHVEQMVPLGRTGGPDDLKGVVVFLASPAAAYVTGHILAVDGGLLAR